MNLNPLPIRFGSIYIDIKRYPNQYLTTQKVIPKSPLPHFTVSVLKDRRNTVFIRMPEAPKTEPKIFHLDISALIPNSKSLKDHLETLSSRPYQQGDAEILHTSLSPVFEALRQLPDTYSGLTQPDNHKIAGFFKGPQGFGHPIETLLKTHITNQLRPREIPPGECECPFIHSGQGDRVGRIPLSLFKDQCVYTLRHGRDIYDGIGQTPPTKPRRDTP